MIEYERPSFPRRIAEVENRQLRIEGGGWSGFFAGQLLPAPGDAAVLEQLTTVAANSVFITKVEEKLCVASFEPRISLGYRAHNSALQLVAKLRHHTKAVR